jgi:hypothetical protein
MTARHVTPLRVLVAIGFAVGLGGFSYEPSFEGGRPAAAGGAWDRLAAGTRLLTGPVQHGVAFDPSVRALEGRPITLEGYLQPMAAGAIYRRFILVAAACAQVCERGRPTDRIEVIARKPVRFETRQIAVTGRLRLVSDSPTGLYVHLEDGVVS